MSAYRLALHRKNPLVLPKMPRVQVALHPVDQHRIHDGDGPLGTAGELHLGRPPRPLLQGAQHHHEIIAVVDKVARRERQHLGNPGAGGPHEIEDQTVGRVFFGVEQAENFGFEQVGGHRIDSVEDHLALGDQAIPVDLDVLNGERIKARLARVEEPFGPGRRKCPTAVLNPYHFTLIPGAYSSLLYAPFLACASPNIRKRKGKSGGFQNWGFWCKSRHF